MNLQKLNEYIASFSSQYRKNKNEPVAPHWESLAVFQDNWDVDASDFAGMYDRSLQNSQTKRLWKREAWEPKEMMIRFAHMQPEFVRRMFKDLYDEGKDISGRVSRFKFGLDAMLEEYKERNPRRIDNNHYHDDTEMICLYLAFRYPEKYCLLHYPSFRKMTELLLVKDPPSPFETDRFFKITRIWSSFLAKNKTLLECNNNGFTGEAVIGFLVFDFYDCGQ